MSGDPVAVNFGCLPALPPGYSVFWHPRLEMFMGHGPDEWESPICWNRFWVRSWCVQRAREAEVSDG